MHLLALSSGILALILSVDVALGEAFFPPRGNPYNNRKKALIPHHFMPRPPHFKGKPPPRGVPPCIPTYLPKPKPLTKTVIKTVTETVYETEFFPTTIFTSKFTLPPDPSTVVETSYVTSTSTNTKLEPVYFTTTEVLSKSVTQTVTQLIPDPRQLLNPPVTINPTPQVIVRTVTQEVFVNDANPPFTATSTVTVTRTERMRDPDCSRLANDGGFLRNDLLDSLRKLPGGSSYSPPLLHSGSSSFDSLNDISQSNSDPLKSFSEPIPSSFPNTNQNYGDFGSFQRSLNGHANSFSIPTGTFNIDNKLLDIFGASQSPSNNPNDFLSFYEQLLNDQNTPDVTPRFSSSTYNSKDVSFKPSRPDPTSISDIINSDEYSYEDDSYKAEDNTLKPDQESVYNTVSIYHSGEQDPSLKEGDVYIHDYSDQGGPIHIKEIMKGVQGGEIHEVIHNFGEEEHRNSYAPEGYGNSLPPIYHPNLLGDDSSSLIGGSFPASLSSASNPRSQLSNLLRNTLNLNRVGKQVHQINPSLVEFDSYGRKSGSNLYRSGLVDDGYQHPLNRKYRATYGQYSAQKSNPVVIALNGTKITDIFSNSSSNTFTPSPRDTFYNNQISLGTDLNNLRSSRPIHYIRRLVPGGSDKWIPLIKMNQDSGRLPQSQLLRGLTFRNEENSDRNN